MAKHFKALLVLIIVLGVSLLIALALATRSTDSFAYNYTTLLYLNIAVIFTMSALLLVLGYWLFQRWRKNVFGTRLLTRFAFSFVLLAVVPSVLLFFISTLFVSRTIDSWFGLKLDSALNAGIDFGRDRLLRTRDLTQEQLARLVTQNPNALNNPNNAEAQAWLQSNGWRTILGINAQGVITWRIDQTGSDEANITQHLPIFNQDTLSKVGTQWVLIEDDADNLIDPNDTAVPRQYIHAIQALGTSAKTPQTTRWIYAQKVMPSDFSSRVRDIQNGLRDYQATEVSRISLRQLYRVTLGIILLVTLLAALAAAFLIANRMIQPILWLAQATRQVASGHYALVPQRVKGSDEMLQLVDSFGDMAQKLNVTQTTLAHNQHELESAKAYSEAVLDNLSSGVLVFNQNLQLQSFNQTAQRMFHTDLTQYVQQNLRDIEPLSALQSAIENQMQTQSTPETGVQNDSWRIQQSLANPASPHHDDMTLSIQGSRFLAQDETYSWVLVCDDVTPIISAQRTLAWGEVARRLAHEIKNPLTPIQLSAERLNVKLSKKLDTDGQAFLEKSTRTIVN
ncbi:MAG: HAMP domain-containing protein, partial [Burkholderiaceae bacterium]